MKDRQLKFVFLLNTTLSFTSSSFCTFNQMTVGLYLLCLLTKISFFSLWLYSIHTNYLFQPGSKFYSIYSHNVNVISEEQVAYG